VRVDMDCRCDGKRRAKERESRASCKLKREQCRSNEFRDHRAQSAVIMAASESTR